MTIDLLVRRAAPDRSHGRRLRGFRVVATALTGAAALLLGALTAPASAANDDPSAPFKLPSFVGGSGSWSKIFSGPNDTDYLRSGGVECAKPSPLPASDAGDGSGQGYRVPFVMALTDGRAIAGYAPRSLKAGLFPWAGDVYGVTGWVRGWVELPSLRVTIPGSGVTLCPGSGVVWGGLDHANYSPALIDAPLAAPDFTGTNHAWSEVLPTGAPQAAITGVTPGGALEFSASMPVQVHAMQNRSDGNGQNDCTFNVDMNLSTTKQPLPTSFPKIDGLLPADPSKWASQADYDKYYQNPFDMQSTPPDHYYMPPRALAGAITGQTAAVANATMTLPPASPPSPPRTGACKHEPRNDFAGTIQRVLLPGSAVNGTLQAARPSGQTTCYPNYGCITSLLPWYNMFKSGDLSDEGLVPAPSGSVQTSVDLTIAGMGIQQGLPSGFGFSS